MVEELRLPLVGGRVEAGFPSPADDFIERSLDLNEQLVANPIATFFVRASGHSMSDEGIRDGDLLVVDRSITPTRGSVVVAIIDGELTVKRIEKQKNKIVVWGVVVWSVHRLDAKCTR
ncbi:MAG: translesion error-prone DNA polymerase V autoproteolytic subunit [Planctomycetes bacterium]|nr:translesion error-prone DNA polymerase V autoproteolytic subunit [Planctomycetota bacterium]